MDIQLLDSLSDTPGLLLDAPTQDSDPFAAADAYSPENNSADAYLLLSPDPFAEHTPLEPETALSTELSPRPTKDELVLHPFDSPAPLPTVPHPPHHSVGAEPQQENRPGNVAPVKRPKNKRAAKAGVKKEVSLEEANRVKDKLAQRKLRNKESARRYREKQVARRRQLENYTRTLTEQNRELESLHDRLLTLTCERRMRLPDHISVPDGVPPGVL